MYTCVYKCIHTVVLDCLFSRWFLRACVRICGAIVAATCRTRAFASCPSRSSDPAIWRCCTPPLSTLSPEQSRLQSQAPHRCFCVFRWALQRGTDWLRSAHVLACVGHPLTYCAVVQAGGCDGTRVAAREDRRAQELEEPVRRCTPRESTTLCHSAAQVHRPMQSYKAPRFDVRPRNLEPVRAAFRCPWSSGSNLAARPHRRDVSNNALKELPKCVCNMSNLTSLYAPPEAWMRHSAAAPSERCCRRNAEHNELQALPDLASASCRPGSTETLLYVCVRCARVLLVGAATEGRLWFVAGSSATTASKRCPDFRPHCSGCARSACR
jgi:hypothetical protein